MTLVVGCSHRFDGVLPRILGRGHLLRHLEASLSVVVSLVRPSKVGLFPAGKTRGWVPLCRVVLLGGRLLQTLLGFSQIVELLEVSGFLDVVLSELCEVVAEVWHLLLLSNVHFSAPIKLLLRFPLGFEVGVDVADRWFLGVALQQLLEHVFVLRIEGRQRRRIDPLIEVLFRSYRVIHVL